MQQSSVNQDFAIDRPGFKFQLEFKFTVEVKWEKVISAHCATAASLFSLEKGEK